MSDLPLVLQRHLQELKEDGYSKTTTSIARTWVLHLLNFCGDRCPTELRSKDLEQWHKQLIWTAGPSGKLYSQNTVNQAVGAIRRFYRLAASDLIEDPTRTLVTPAATDAKKRQLSFTPTEVRKLLSSPSRETPTGIRDRAILGVLLETQISRSACSKIDRDHLCFETGSLFTRGLTQKIHCISDGLAADLKRYLREARPLLINDMIQALFLDRWRLHGMLIT